MSDKIEIEPTAYEFRNAQNDNDPVEKADREQRTKREARQRVLRLKAEALAALVGGVDHDAREVTDRELHNQIFLRSARWSEYLLHRACDVGAGEAAEFLEHMLGQHCGSIVDADDDVTPFGLVHHQPSDEEIDAGKADAVIERIRDRYRTTWERKPPSGHLRVNFHARAMAREKYTVLRIFFPDVLRIQPEARAEMALKRMKRLLRGMPKVEADDGDET